MSTAPLGAAVGVLNGSSVSTATPTWPFAPAGCAVRIALAEAPPGGDLADAIEPFVPLADRSAFSRVLLAWLDGPDGRVVAPLALKLQRDDYALVTRGERGPTNPMVESTWGREVELLDRLAADGVGVPRVVDVLTRQWGEPVHLPPTLFCKRRAAFFVARCPTCAEPLADLRDAGVLDRLGLPRFEASLVRYVACHACGRRGRWQAWTLGTAGDVAGARSDLFVALGDLARGVAGDAVIPCQGCDRVDECHPPAGSPRRPDAVRCLTPLTFHESRCIALEPFPLLLDELAAVIAGRPLAQVVADTAMPGRRTLLAGLATAVDRRSAYLFDHDPAGKLGLEIFRLKLDVFRQLCRAVAAVHRHTQAPHLGLAPDHVLATLAPSPAGLPWLWSVRLAVSGLGSAEPARPLDGEDPGPPVSFERPALVERGFAAPPLLVRPAEEQACTVTLRAIARDRLGRCVLEADVVAPSLDVAAVGERDAIDVVVADGRPAVALRFTAFRTTAERERLAVRSVALSLPEDTSTLLAQLIGRELGRGRCTVRPCLHVPCDVYSLGVILAVILVADAEQTAAVVRRHLEALGSAIEPFAREDPDAATARAAALLDDADPFARRHLVDDPRRFGAAADGIPPGLWTRALVLALRATVPVRGFGLCAGWDDFDPGHPEVVTEHLVGLVDALVREVDAVLFGLPGRTREVAAALERVARAMQLDVPGATQ